MGRFSSNDLEVNRIKAFVLVARQLWTVLVRKRVPKVLRIKSGLGSLICNSAHRLAFNRIFRHFQGDLDRRFRGTKYRSLPAPVRTRFSFCSRCDNVHLKKRGQLPQARRTATHGDVAPDDQGYCLIDKVTDLGEDALIQFHAEQLRA